MCLGLKTLVCEGPHFLAIYGYDFIIVHNPVIGLRWAAIEDKWDGWMDGSSWTLSQLTLVYGLFIPDIMNHQESPMSKESTSMSTGKN